MTLNGYIYSVAVTALLLLVNSSRLLRADDSP